MLSCKIRCKTHRAILSSFFFFATVSINRQEKGERTSDTEGEREQQWQGVDGRQRCHELGGSGIRVGLRGGRVGGG